MKSMNLPKTFTVGIDLELWKIKTDKLYMFVNVLILKTWWRSTLIYLIQLCIVKFTKYYGGNICQLRYSYNFLVFIVKNCMVTM